MTAFSPISPAAWLTLGAGGLGASSIFASVATSAGIAQTPGKRTLIYWMPIALVVLVARLLGGWEIAIGLIFGTSVAILSAVLGALSLTAPVGPGPTHWKRLWPFTLVAALIVFVSGFNGLLNWKHGIALFAEGLALFSLWRDSSALCAIDRPHDEDRKSPLLPDEAAWVSLGIGMLLAVVGAFIAVKACLVVQPLRPHLSAGTVSATLLSVVLVAPMVQADRRVALDGASWLAATAEIGVVLLNLCFLLPIVALAPYAAAYFRAMRTSTRLTIDWSTYSPHVTAFPLSVWRIDTVAIVLLSLLLLPAATGKWNLGREEGLVLIMVYLLYLAAVTIVGSAPV